MAKKTDYNSNHIQVLSDRDHVRLRLPMYAGSIDPIAYSVPNFINNSFTIENTTLVPAALKCINEIIDNSIDEFTHITKANKKLTIISNQEIGQYTISDNGRGVPIDIHPQTGKYTPETVFGSLRSGRNFGEKDTVGIIGTNGIGSSMCCYVSKKFIIDILRDKKHYHQEFIDGASTITKPKITNKDAKDTGTAISFQLDPEVFKDTIIADNILHNKAIEVAFNNPGVTVEYNKHKYLFKKGFEEVLNKISKQYYKFSSDTMEFYIAFDLNTSIDEQIFTWVNGTYLFEGGICNTQFFNSFFDKTISHLSKEAKKQKCEVTKNDVRQNLTVFGILKLKNPNFDSQSKTRLTGPNLRKEIDELVETHWNVFAKKNKEWFEDVIARAYERHNNDSNKKALKAHQKNLTKRVPGLTDATNKDRSKCMVFITEGLSASSKIIEVRDPSTQAFFPLTGKINNVYGNSPAEILKMSKVASLLSVIGLVPGQKVDRSQLRYGNKIIIATDGDVDGSDIFSLLINLFYMWPELFDPKQPPIIHRLIVPNICLIKGKNRVHLPSIAEYEAVKHKYDGYQVKYYKGLGGMVKEDWSMIMNNLDNTLLPIIDDGNLKDTLKLLFDNDADARKVWLQTDPDVQV
jgi:DNA gyrase subunit B